MSTEAFCSPTVCFIGLHQWALQRCEWQMSRSASLLKDWEWKQTLRGAVKGENQHIITGPQLPSYACSLLLGSTLSPSRLIFQRNICSAYAVLLQSCERIMEIAVWDRRQRNKVRLFAFCWHRPVCLGIHIPTCANTREVGAEQMTCKCLVSFRGASLISAELQQPTGLHDLDSLKRNKQMNTMGHYEGDKLIISPLGLLKGIHCSAG